MVSVPGGSVPHPDSPDPGAVFHGGARAAPSGYPRVPVAHAVVRRRTGPYNVEIQHPLHERVDMPLATVNGISLNYQVKGDRAKGAEVPGGGPLVVMIMGTGSPGRVWELHQ